MQSCANMRCVLDQLPWQVSVRKLRERAIKEFQKSKIKSFSIIHP